MASGHIVINQERCKGCALCLAACPPGVIELADSLNTLGYRPATLNDPDHLCTGCGLCAVVCPDASIVVYRTLVPVHRERTMAEVV
ncbi:MAG: 4Fe-4S dicluster domain-containing protein [Candidatus Promineifilaceae bacterium]